jgi:hypothetical protein
VNSWVSITDCAYVALEMSHINRIETNLEHNRPKALVKMTEYSIGIVQL